MDCKKIYIPDASTSEGKKGIESTQSFVIVGANGSGKSHLGAWIEKNNKNVLRISAQRALSIPDNINIKDSEASWNKIFYGNETYKDKVYKWSLGKETSTLTYDFESVLSLLFSEDYSQLRRNREKKSQLKTIADIVEEIWDKIMPQRQVVFDKFNVLAKHGEETYKAGVMSDGERVCLYLISQCLLTPDNYVIVIDEPEIHLHLSIMKSLWDEIEKICPNKTFVYITHNLQFASSRNTATKIWVKSYDGHNKWDLSVVNKTEDIPEELLLEILGTRSPVLFVEGDESSYDIALYQEVFENYHVVACHNCQKVIELTKAFNNERVRCLHSIAVKGIIDHDFLSQEEIDSYTKQNIYSIEVSEVENLFLIEPLIKFAAERIGGKPDEIFTKVSDFLFDKLQKEKQEIINAICVKEIRHRLSRFSSDGQHVDKIEEDLNKMVSYIDINAIYSQAESNITDIIARKDYKSLIKLYNNKGLCGQVGGIIGFKKPYPQIILDLLKGENREKIVTALKEYLPSI